MSNAPTPAASKASKDSQDTETYLAVRRAALALLAGAVLSASNVTAGNGIVVDWREVKCGETLLEGGDAFDAARLFVALVGSDFDAPEAPEPPPVPRAALRSFRYGIPAGDGTYTHQIDGFDDAKVLVSGERSAEVTAAIIAALSKAEVA